MGRMLRRPADAFTTPEDYEAVTGPVFAWIDAVAQQARTGDAFNGAPRCALGARWAAGAWRAPGAGRRPVPQRIPAGASLSRSAGLRARAGGAFPLAVGALNRAGLGPLRATSRRRAAPRGPARDGRGREALATGGDVRYVVFGHTHRAGPLPGDVRSEWIRPGGCEADE